MVEHLRDSVLWEAHQKVPAANVFVNLIAAGITEATRLMQIARERQSDYAVKRNRLHNFQVGERALLSSKNIKLRSDGTPKLQPHWLGPFNRR